MFRAKPPSCSPANVSCTAVSKRYAAGQKRNKTITITITITLKRKPTRCRPLVLKHEPNHMHRSEDSIHQTGNIDRAQAAESNTEQSLERLLSPGVTGFN